MLSDADLKAPARLRYQPAAVGEGQIDWNGAREFPSLREAIHWAMTEEAPAGQEAFIQASSGTVLRPEMLDSLWSSLQGP